MTTFTHLIGGALIATEDESAPRVAFRRPVGALPAQAWCTLSTPQYQRSASSCLPHAGCFVLEADVKARTGAEVQVSIMDAYRGYRVLAGDWPRDVGSYPHKMQEWHAAHGTLPDTLAPYDPALVTTWKPSPALASLRPAWTAAFERMPLDVDQIRAELAADRCVVVCHHVYAQMAGTGVGQAGRTGWESAPAGGGLGGHARAVAGYDDARQAFLIVNWWQGWGVPHPLHASDARFVEWKDSCSWVPYSVLTDPAWGFDARRLVRGLEVLT